MPSAEPRRASDARSGCGMSPTTLRCSLQTPAMSSRLPFGLRTYRQHGAIVVAQATASSRRTHVVALEVVDRAGTLGLGQRSRASDSSRPGSPPSSHRKVRPAFFWARRARSASTSTWKPLQMPTTGPPAATQAAPPRP